MGGWEDGRGKQGAGSREEQEVGRQEVGGWKTKAAACHWGVGTRLYSVYKQLTVSHSCDLITTAADKLHINLGVTHRSMSIGQLSYSNCKMRVSIQFAQLCSATSLHGDDLVAHSTTLGALLARVEVVSVAIAASVVERLAAADVGIVEIASGPRPTRSNDFRHLAHVCNRPEQYGQPVYVNEATLEWIL